MKEKPVKMKDSDILAFTEAYRFYLLLEDDARNKIPQDIVDFLEKHKDLSMGAPISPQIPLDMQDISQEGWHVITYLSTFL